MAEDTQELEKSKYERPPRTPYWAREGRKPVPPSRETLVKGIANLSGISPWKVERILLARRKKEQLTQPAKKADNLPMEQAETKVPEKEGQYKGLGLKTILKETEKFEKKQAPAPTEPVQPAAPAETPPLPSPPTAEEALRLQFRESRKGVQPKKESWLRRALSRLSPRKPEQAGYVQTKPRIKISEEQKRWAELAESRRGDLDRSATTYRIRETKQMGPLKTRG